MVKKVRVSLQQARESAERLGQTIKRSLPGVRIEFAGSIRRADPGVGDIDLLIECELQDLIGVPGLLHVSDGAERATMSWEGRQLDVWRVHPGTWGSMLFWVTGPAHYNVWYARKAQAKGLKLSGKGLFRGDQMIAGEDEEGIFRALDKEWKDPSKRGK